MKENHAEQVNMQKLQCTICIRMTHVLRVECSDCKLWLGSLKEGSHMVLKRSKGQLPGLAGSLAGHPGVGFAR